MKKIIFVIVLIIFGIFPFLIFADSNISLETVLDEIKKSQNIEKTSDIDCAKITDNQFEKLGDAVMGTMHPEERQHELMDKMMGGEGSESLKAMHILTGEKYLGCDSGQMGMMGNFGMMGMMNMFAPSEVERMGGGMMGGESNPRQYNLPNNFNNMMTNFGYFGWFGGIFMLLFWVLIIVGIIALIKWIARQAGTSGKEKSPLEILKERYAKGEINKKDFEEKKKDLI